MEKVFNKLVRDNIPDIIISNGDEPVIKILSDDEYKIELFNKLEEEKNEVVGSSSKEDLTEELADLYEVLDAILEANDISSDEVNNVKNDKRLKRGGFDKKIFLEKTVNKED